MKLKVKWKELGKQLWAAVQSMGVYAFGLPAVAIITQSEQIAPRVAAPPGSLARGDTTTAVATPTG